MILQTPHARLVLALIIARMLECLLLKYVPQDHWQLHHHAHHAIQGLILMNLQTLHAQLALALTIVRMLE